MSDLRPELMRITSAALDRRGFLRVIGLGGAALAAGPLLSACGTEGTDNAAGAPGAGSAQDATTVNWSNWPLYLDTAEDDASVHPTLQAFEQQTGLSVAYTEDINSNDEFFGKIAPQLEAGRSTGRDLIVLTDWMAGRMIQLGYVQELDKSNIPNASNLQPAYQDVPFDPGRRYSLPWQSGMTGIAYNPEELGREITRVDDLFQPDLRGRITMLSEMRDTMGLILLSMGKTPEDHSQSDYEAAIAKLQEIVDEGYVRQFTGNEYAADLAAGNIGAAFAWSGDVVQLQADDPALQLVLPAEGAILWSDNLMVPAGAANKEGAEQLINHYYDPEVAAQVAAWVNYVTPVAGAREAALETAPDVATNPLIFPTPEILANLHGFKALTEEEEREYQDLFQAVIGA
ncbi:spermidine/putrescine ABC transporter substrate-binding protein [Blastococcus sp. BMG 814]|uniref:Spermidine/putrescine ABC transporter substrate-binding protein n=1 Tax=Blastococcus carthaginiensis TaxID=3050034 RepID=A0ABT9IBM2_9ACTN|nr:spermidine/putrescine ABC transporter substrate-binding protein [Blastococcus carthaginiensis]MDP5182959.1 spermidine/putrescine ABC transporter substrate-binding protein [Blastococcus carthaginiensis]